MMKFANNGQPPKALIAAVQRLLRPLIRGFIRFGLTYPLLSDILKRTYVEIADEDFRIYPDKSPSDSRISLLTRVHRKDVRKFRAEDMAPPLNLSGSSVAAQIIARWLGRDDLLDKEGRPIALPRLGENSFDALAREISKDMHPRAMLDELVRSDTVRLDEDDIVHLNTNAFLPRKDFDELAYYFGLNLHEHIAASVHNVSGKKNPFLDRSVHYSGLSAASVQVLKADAERIGMAALLELNGKAQKLEAKDRSGMDTDQLMTFGIYFHHDRESKDE